jgi:hypothetical protein
MPECYGNPDVKQIAENVGNMTLDEIVTELKEPKKAVAAAGAETVAWAVAEAGAEENKAEESPNTEFEQEFKKRYKDKLDFRIRLRIALYTSIGLVTVLIISSLFFTYEKLNEYYKSEEYRIKLFVKDWKYALEMKDIFKYKDLLDKDYQYTEKSGKPINFDERSKRIEKMFDTYKRISVKADDMKITMDTSSVNYANVTFNQTISLDKKEEKGKKTLRLFRENGAAKWKIFREIFE